MNIIRPFGLFACLFFISLLRPVWAQQAIINEWSQGPSGCTSEWIEILVIQDGLDMRGWSLRESTPTPANIVTFNNSPLWASLPAGALIVVYNPNSACGKDPVLGPDDLTLGCDYSYTVSGSDPTLFSSNWSSAVAFSNTTATDNPELWDAGGNLVQDWDQGNAAGFTSGTLRPGSNQAVYYVGNDAAGVSNPANWVRAASNASQITPARPNVAANGVWIRSLQRPSVRFTVPATSFCEGDVVVLTVDFEGQAPFNYTYTDGVNSFNGTAASSPHTISITLSAGNPQYWFTSVTNALFPVTGPTCDTVTLTVTPNPVLGTIVGPLDPCAGSSVRYYVDGGIQNQTSQGWSVPVGWLITAGASTDTVTVTVGNNGGNVGITGFNSCTSVFNFVAVTSNDVPAMSAIIGPDSVCQGEVVQYVVQGGIQNFTPPVSWSFPTGWTVQGGNGSDTVDVLTTSDIGLVSITATNVCGTRTLNLNVVDADSLPTVAGIVGAATHCLGDTVTFTAQSGNANATNFAWTVPNSWAIVSGQGTDAIRARVGVLSGNVTLEVSSRCGAINASLAVQSLSAPNVLATLRGATTPCVGDTVQYDLPGIPSGATVNWILPPSWSLISGQGNDTVFVQIGTSDTIRAVVSNQCGSVNRFLVVNTSAKPSFATAIQGDDTPCPFRAAVYTVGGLSNANAPTWSFPPSWRLVSGQGTATLTVLPDTTSGFVILRDSNACGFTADTLLVTPNLLPGVIAIKAANDTICNGSSTIIALDGFGGAGDVYSWSPTTGIIGATNTDQAVVSPSATTTYTLTVTNGGCTASASITIVVQNVIDVQVSASSPTHCIGSIPIALQATGAVSYTWSPAAGLSGTNIANPTATPTTTTTYTVVGTDAQGCVDSASITITVVQPFVPVINGDVEACVNSPWGFGECTNCQTGDVITWILDGQTVSTGTSPAFSFTQVTNTAVQHAVRIRVTRGGCDFTSADFVVTTVPNVETNSYQTTPLLTPGEAIASGTTVQFLSQSPTANFYRWIFVAPDGSRDTVSGISPFAIYTFTQEGRYDVLYSTARQTASGFACSFNSSGVVDVKADLKDIIVHIPNVFSPNGDGINDDFRVTIIGNIQTYAMRIYDRWGGQVFTSDSPTDNWRGSDAPEGVYVFVLQILANNGKKTEYSGSLTLLR